MRICNNCGEFISGGNYIKLFKGGEYEGNIEYCNKCYDNIVSLFKRQAEQLSKRIIKVDKII